MIEQFAAIVGPANVLTGDAAAPWARDWTGNYEGLPAAVVRPASTAEVSQVLAAANAAEVPVVPVSGNTGLNGGAFARDAVVVSLDRMRAIREVRASERVAVVEAGVILSELHDAAEAEGLIFPMTFGARGSARIGGILSTNAGGSNVLRYGNTRQLVLGIEAVLADGRVLDLMTALHKDNTGPALGQLMIGAEGMLGVITGAVLKLAPQPRAYATAMVAVRDLDTALTLLNRLQDASGGAVEAFEYMPANYIARHLEVIAGARPPFDAAHETNILVELGATAARDATPGPDGTVPLAALLEETLAAAFEEGLVADAVVAQTEAQRREMWARRESAAEITFHRRPFVDTDIAVPLHAVQAFLDGIRARLAALDPDADDFVVAHLGDGNIHYTVYPGRDDPALMRAIREAIDDTAVGLGGTFSAEHGIGLSKLGAMARHKNPVALDALRAIKAALDPNDILNRGKTIPR
ncbi:probable oxidoreductase [Oceanicola granulosus HTCC2516]|uniref:Probable oxidoreductase n=1 Tax=Oceanicola granulosus (strain ATCC BAA-861 / DSM 15982 / KCTC 12143 / HTCC2516) TaxID=314256 RepID=Q2CDN4_OCEGH|nr:FAD-binding oxidoreductase [Oceanicola granulosus]EAR50816.1 probable oxidoreductase [Oceanicola granulosus HTCC2516]